MNLATESSRHAVRLTAIYAVLAGIYIFVSTSWAASTAHSVEQMRAVELWKGLGFVTVSSLVLFIVARKLFARLGRVVKAKFEIEEAFQFSQQRATIGLFAASIAHDLNNFLSVLQFGMEELQATDAPPDRELVEDMAVSVTSARDLAARLMQVGSGHEETEPESFDVAEELNRVIETVNVHTDVKRRDVDLDCESGLVFNGFRPLIDQLIMNLVLNAAEATDSGGSIRIRCRAISDGIVVEVHDDGPGVPDDQREELFGPFFTTKESGTGLGLISVKACAARHDGSVEVEDSPLGGACFRVILRAR